MTLQQGEKVATTEVPTKKIHGNYILLQQKIIAINDVSTIKVMQLNHTTTNKTVAFTYIQPKIYTKMHFAFLLGIKCYAKELYFTSVTSEPKLTTIIFVSCLIY